MRTGIILLFAVFAFSTFSVTQSSHKHTRTATDSVRLPGAAFAAMQKIDPERIRAHVRFLSHDLLEGRGTGQRGGDIAAEYIATQFALYGLKPAGDNGTYMQKVPMVGITPAPETTFSLVSSTGMASDLKPLEQYVAYDQTQQPRSDVDAEIVYVGYGIEAPEYQWDDYKGVDVRGKVLLMLVNEPPSDDVNFFKGKALTYYGRWTYKYEEAARKRRNRRDSCPSNRDGELSLGSRSQLELWREVIPKARRLTQAKGCGVGSVRGCKTTDCWCGHGPGQDDGGCAFSRFPSGDAASEIESTHGEQDSPV